METGGVGLVGADLVVDFDETLLDDEGDLTSGESVLQTVADEDLHKETLLALSPLINLSALLSSYSRKGASTRAACGDQAKA